VLKGYSGEDVPRSVIPSLLGVLDGESGRDVQKQREDVEMAGEEAKKGARYISGRTEIGRLRDNMRIQPLFQEDATMNFDVLEELLAASLDRTLHLPIKDTPLLFTEDSIHNKQMRLKLTEFLFERLQAPSIFLCKDAVLSSFACGRSTAIVLDSGAEFTTATPVHDGYALQKCTLRNKIGGTFITGKLHRWLTEEARVEVKPRFSFTRKFSNVEGVEKFTTTPLEVKNCDPGFFKYSQTQIVRDIKEEFLYASEEPLQGLGAA